MQIYWSGHTKIEVLKWEQQRAEPKKGNESHFDYKGRRMEQSHHFVDDERSRKEFHSSCHICAALTIEKARNLQEDALRKGTFVFP